MTATKRRRVSRKSAPSPKSYKPKKGTGVIKQPPGLYSGVPFEDYLRWEGINNSSLGPMVDGSPAEYRWCLENPKEQTEALRIGRLVHEGRLEPANLLKRYWVLDEEAVRKQCRTTDDREPKDVGAAKRTKVWAEIVAQLAAANDGKERITQAELDIIVGLATSLSQDRECASLIVGAQLELSWVRKYKVGRNTVKLKGRIDIAPLENDRLADFKTCRGTDDRTISNSIKQWGYHRQASFYQHAWEDLVSEGELLPFWAIFGAKDKHFEVRAAPIHGEDLELGEQQWRKAVEQIVECRKRDHWPAREHPGCFRLPKYARPDLDIEMPDGEVVSYG